MTKKTEAENIFICKLKNQSPNLDSFFYSKSTSEFHGKVYKLYIAAHKQTYLEYYIIRE